MSLNVGNGWVLNYLNTYVGYVGSGNFNAPYLYAYTVMAGLMSASIFYVFE